MKSVLHRFDKVFKEPQGLPPERQQEHVIHLLTGQGPVNVRPYLYPHHHKTQIEKQVKKLLLSGVIRPSQSAFSRPLTDLTKKECFKWGAKEQAAFEELKHKVTSAPVLALPYFTKEFFIESDASDNGLGEILIQDKKPIAFFIKGLSDMKKN
ncbi:hypothetical protein KIW84_065383 [Lathyrus oleraceus]|uniref:Reverse transcriptase/retrotransposon-derived protein RNase H-like domain-containing protein n=1 Tax=Pisum sativum TaxID=3888 RepID=A0A9D5A7C9_PEA|nr:hypothetical protein KIW84_065383 [Pisum sativum]